jgi:hypothetical protein
LFKDCHHCTTPFNGRGLYCPDCRDTASPWRLNEDTLRSACKQLGITMTVRIRRTNLPVAYGAYHGIRKRRGNAAIRGQIAEISGTHRPGEYHLITIIPRLTPAFASRVLWHELSHARDREHNPHHDRSCRLIARRLRREAQRDGRSPWSAYASYPWEIRASANEELHDVYESLTHANTRATMPPSTRSRLIERVDGGRITYATTFEDALESSMRRVILSAQHQRHLDRKAGEPTLLVRHRARDARKGPRKRPNGGPASARTRKSTQSPAALAPATQRARLHALRRRLADQRAQVATRTQAAVEREVTPEQRAARSAELAATLRLRERHVLDIARTANRTAKRHATESAVVVRPSDVTADDVDQAMHRDLNADSTPRC